MNRLFFRIFVALSICLAAGWPLRAQSAAQPAAVHSAWTVEEFMVPMRDGVRLQTTVIRKASDKRTLPILLRRTPYGVPTQETFDTLAAQQHDDGTPINLRELAADGYIFVVQNLRGRFKSEGTFLLTSRYDANDPKQANETNDAYDTIDWLIRNLPNNNGRVGIYGVSYDGLTAGLTLLHPHPALKAVSEQASPVDQWMNDDDHRYGALRESYSFEYAVLEQADKNKNTDFEFETYDTYEWYLNAGPLHTLNDKYLHGTLPYWNDEMAHPNYDDFWKKESWVSQLHSTSVPTLNVAGFWDQEDPWGPWQIFRHEGEHDPESADVLVAGPWFHGGWHMPEGDTLGPLSFAGHKTALEFRRQIEAPFFRHYLHESGEKPAWKVTTFETGSNEWKTYAAWPPPAAKTTSLYFHADGTLSFDAPTGAEAPREYVSDPANPVPYRARPISPTYPRPEWRFWEVADQRFVDHRPDVLTYVSAPLDRDIAVAGPVAAKLWAASSGTDSDFVVKLIDVFPETGQKSAIDSAAYANSMNGYELPIAMEVRRGRFLKSFEHPEPLTANKPVEWEIPLRDRDHVFLKGHRIMVQVQSTWFPLIDRNPQRFVKSINNAVESDFVKATQRVWSTPSMASRIELPVVQ